VWSTLIEHAVIEMEENSEPKVDYSESLAIAQGFEVGYPQKSPQSSISVVARGEARNRKSKKTYGS